ncbi:alpha/beta hydrolase family protein [Actinomadura flavalba]|uniref:alpha/beta hydrolase family protein n=1 Tax=Actinomadura flavalba TaxID=1120938 RepID=UPI00036D9570|nr:alpha/beta hydrolase [Actinomadura flavalba]
MNSTFVKRLRLLPAGTALVCASLGFGVAPAHADPSHQRGPDPTEASVKAERGTYAVGETKVNRGTGFNRGTIYYPDTKTDGTFGAIAVMPGFVSPQSTIQWFGPRLASYGFVVITLDSAMPMNFPTARSNQQLAALDYLVKSSPVRDRIDASRLAVIGHSMGGGGSLWSAQKRTSLKAAIPLAPWEYNSAWDGVRTPTLVIGGEDDKIAPVGGMASNFFTKLTNAPEKAYLELRGGNHWAPTQQSPVVNKYTLSWLKRYVDGDERYSKFLCPAPATDTAISEYRDTCPA